MACILFQEKLSYANYRVLQNKNKNLVDKANCGLRRPIGINTVCQCPKSASVQINGHIHLKVSDLLFVRLQKNPGPSCSKLTMALVNDSLKFTSSDTQICRNGSLYGNPPTALSR